MNAEITSFKKCPFWIYKARGSKPTEKGILISYQEMSDREKMFFSKLPEFSFILVTRNNIPESLGYVYGNTKYEVKKNRMRRKFKTLLLNTQGESSALLTDFQDSIFNPVDTTRLYVFEKEILETIFRCSWNEIVNLMLISERNRKQRKNIVYNWSPDKEVKTDKKVRSRRDIKKSEDALAPWRRMPGAGFTRG